MKAISIPFCRLWACVCIMALAAVPATATAEPSLKALLVTGQNNHNWQLSSPIIKTILEDSGLFSVDKVVTPPEGEDMSAFSPVFSDYHVVVLDYTGDAWQEEVREAFVTYVRDGGGVVVIHAANNAFPEWTEFNEIIGLGGWGGRDERHGPYLRWRNGEIVYDMTPGSGGAHGRQHAFVVTHRDTEHPITRGLPEAWLHAQDELYHGLRGPANNMTLLATAYSAPETGGSGEHEPALFTVSYGEGRMFQTVLGHAGDTDPPPAFQCVGFIVTLQRGAEWAATGAVTQAVPDDFPPADVVRLRPRFRQETLDDLMAELTTYQYNDSLEPLAALEALTRKRTRMDDSVDDLEQAYLVLLQSKDATKDAKLFACKQLSLVGGRRSVPLLAEMLLKEDLAYMARYALERIPEHSALTALREALPVVEAEHRAGIATSLGVRGDTRAVPVISTAVHDEDPRVVVAAIRALAAIGTTDAAASLLAATELKEGDMRRLSMDAYVQCGFELLNARRTRDARELFDHAYQVFYDIPVVRAVALRGRVAAAGRRGGDIIIEALRSGDAEMQAVAAAEVRAIDNENALQAIAAIIPEVIPQAQVYLLAGLSETGVTGLSPLLMATAASNVEEVRIAALKALSHIGEAEAALFLVRRAMTSTGMEQETARYALGRLRGATPIILDALETEDVALRPELLLAVSRRRITEAVPVLIEQMTAADTSERMGYLNVLAEIAKPEHLDMIIPLLLAADESEEQAKITQVVTGVADREETEEVSVATIQKALETETEASAKSALYAVLGQIAGASALPLLAEGLNEEDATVRLAAVEALANWPDDRALPVLRDALERYHGAPEGYAALAGFIRGVEMNEDRPTAETVALLKDAAGFADTVADRQAVIRALGRTGAAPVLPMLYDALISDDVEIAIAAARALGAWPDATPMVRLELLAKDGPDEVKREALRGYLRLVGVNQEISDAEAVIRYKEAFALAADPAEKKRMLSSLSNAKNMGALRVVMGYLDHPELKAEAEVGAARIAAHVASSYPDDVAAVLEELDDGTESTFVRGEIRKIQEQIAQFEDYITAWEVAGPYTLDEGGLKDLFETPFPPEDADMEDEVQWHSIPVGSNESKPFLVELDKALGGSDRVAYLRSFVWSDTVRDVLLEIGSDDGNKVWVNDELINAEHATRALTPAQDIAEASLDEGWNTLLMKVTQAGGEWSACARFRTLDGEPVTGIRASTRPR